MPRTIDYFTELLSEITNNIFLINVLHKQKFSLCHNREKTISFSLPDAPDITMKINKTDGLPAPNLEDALNIILSITAEVVDIIEPTEFQDALYYTELSNDARPPC